MLRHYPKLFSEWDFEKNDELGLDIYKVTFGSGRTAWWNCEKNHSFDVSIHSKIKSKGCPICLNRRILIGYNDMWTTNPELASMLDSPEDGYKYTQFSNQKIDWKCLDCGNKILQKSVTNTNKAGLSCPVCSDGVSFPEKFIYHILRDNKIEFEFEKIFPWLKNKKYDFYIPSLNCIIEVHGEHHTTGKYRNKYVRDESGNDRFKKETALKNGIEEYIEIDAEKSYGSYISQSILNIKTPYKIWLIADFQDIEKRASQTLMKDVWKLWNEGESVGKIAEEMNLSRPTIRKYLKRGAFAGACDYSTKKSRKRSGKVNSKSDIWQVPVIQFDKNMNYIKEWRHAGEASREIGSTSSSSIHRCCKGENKTAGGFRWLYKDDYKKKEKDKLNKDITHKGKTVVQISLQGKFIKEWVSQAHAERELGISSSSISTVCNGKQKTSGGFMWIHKEDYELGVISKFTEKRKT